MKNRLRVFEAFAGYGSQAMAIRNLGIDYEVVAISEIDKYAIKAYEAVHGPTLNLGDISQINVEDIPEHDLFTYSFPCTDISVAGKQEGLIRGQTRSGLLYECEKIIEHCRPKYLLMENVRNLVGKKFKSQFDEWLKYLESLGYTNYWKILNAKDYEIPQNRQRVFVISIHGEHKPYKFPEPIKLKKSIKDILEDEVDEKYYLSEKLINCFMKEKVGNFPRREVFLNNLNRVNESGIASTVTTRAGDRPTDNFLLIPQGTKKGYIEMEVPGVCDLSYPNSKNRRGRVQEGGSVCPTLTTSPQQIYYIDLPCICASRGRNPENPSSRVPGKHTEQRIEINKNGVSNTITTVQKDNYAIEEDFRIRKLTNREIFRLMGVSETDINKIQQAGISSTQQFKLAGNSIVVPVLEHIFRELFLEVDNE